MQVENLQSDDNLPINIESNIQGSLMKSTASEQITEEMMNASYISISGRLLNPIMGFLLTIIIKLLFFWGLITLSGDHFNVVPKEIMVKSVCDFTL